VLASLGWYHVFTGPARVRTVFLYAALIAVFGVLLPWTKGLDFLDPVMTAAYACLGVLFAGPASAEAFAEERPDSMMAALRGVAKAVMYGEGLALVMLIAGVATVSVSRGRRLRLPEFDVLGATGLLGLMASTALALIAGWVTLRFSHGAARRALRYVFLLMLVAFFLWSRWLPDAALRGAALAAVVSGVMIFVLRRQVEPQ
jgi:hypothetical protein